MPNIFITHVGDFDYDPGPYNISFSAGETFKSFNITILDNNTYEASESFNLIISPHSFVLFGTPRQAVTTITDEDDSKCITKYVASMHVVCNMYISKEPK